MVEGLNSSVVWHIKLRKFELQCVFLTLKSTVKYIVMNGKRHVQCSYIIVFALFPWFYQRCQWCLKNTLFVFFSYNTYRNRGITLQKKSPICTKVPLPFMVNQFQMIILLIYGTQSVFLIVDKCQSDVCTLTFYYYNFVLDTETPLWIKFFDLRD